MWQDLPAHHFLQGHFPQAHVPTLFENYVADVEIDGKCVELALWDTDGQEEYDQLRPLSYLDAHVILICFAIDSPGSFGNVQGRWISEIRHYCSGVPVVLVGCKKDLRFDTERNKELHGTSQRPVTPEEGAQVAREIGGHYYLECSAKTGEGVRQLFQYATQVALLRKNRKQKRTKCIVL